MEKVVQALGSFALLSIISLLPTSATKVCLFWGFMLSIGLMSTSSRGTLAWRRDTGVWLFLGAVAGCLLGIIAALGLSGGKPVLSPLAAILLAPVAEEAYYRGYLNNRLQTVLGAAWANAITTVLFSVSHGSLAALVVGLVIGALCAYITTRSASLLPAIALHGVYNLLQVLLWAQGGRIV